jgi:hypothetical protein
MLGFLARNWLFVVAVAAMMLTYFGMHRSGHGGHGGGCGASGHAGSENNGRRDHTVQEDAPTAPPSTFGAGISSETRGSQFR